ncbi:MAG: glycosyltransferase family 4 protein [Verrucomicrobia bacterium]|nr:glycosyltransferase family 4 protein [Verrucomicrobiota bacterium]
MQTSHLREGPGIIVHATNVLGAGAALVACRLIEGIALAGAGRLRVEAWLPDDPRYRAWTAGFGGVQCRLVRRLLPRPVSRFVETILRPPALPSGDHVLVLGDLPLRRVPNQTVFIHLAHLVSPRVDPFVSRALAYRLQRAILRRNLAFAKSVVVQTVAMRDAIGRSYPAQINSIHVIGQPSPLPPIEIPHRRRGPGETLRLLYPARGMPHKNHRLLLAVARRCEQERLPVEFCVTLNQPEGARLLRGAAPNVRNLGVLNEEELVQAYGECDALFFPSLVESYGLPLVEAMTIGRPIIAVDRPYARALCEDGAVYFDPASEQSAVAAVRRVLVWGTGRAEEGCKAALARLPGTWTETAARFLDAMGVWPKAPGPDC